MFLIYSTGVRSDCHSFLPEVRARRQQGSGHVAPCVICPRPQLIMLWREKRTHHVWSFVVAMVSLLFTLYEYSGVMRVFASCYYHIGIVSHRWSGRVWGLCRVRFPGASTLSTREPFSNNNISNYVTASLFTSQSNNRVCWKPNLTIHNSTCLL